MPDTKFQTGVLARFQLNDGTWVAGAVKGMDEGMGMWVVESNIKYVSPLEVDGWEVEQVAHLMGYTWRELALMAVSKGCVKNGLLGSGLAGKLGLCAMLLLKEAEAAEPVLVVRQAPVEVMISLDSVDTIWVLEDEAEESFFERLNRE